MTLSKINTLEALKTRWEAAQREFTKCEVAFKNAKEAEEKEENNQQLLMMQVSIRCEGIPVLTEEDLKALLDIKFACANREADTAYCNYRMKEAEKEAEEVHKKLVFKLLQSAHDDIDMEHFKKTMESEAKYLGYFSPEYQGLGSEASFAGSSDDSDAPLTLPAPLIENPSSG